MKTSKNIYKFILGVILAALVISSCGQRSQKPQKPTSGPKKPPQELEKLSEGVEGVISQLQSIHKELNKPMEEKLKEEEERVKKEQEKKNQQQGGQQGGQGGGGGGGSQEVFMPGEPKATQEKLLELWKKTNDAIESLHKSWNSYRGKAVKDGAKQASIEAFESSINQLAIEGDNKSLETAIEYANNSSKYIADFKEIYKSNPPPDIERLKYFAREAAIKSNKEEWEEAKRNAGLAQKSWDRAKTKVKKDDMDKMTMLDLAIKDYVQVVEKRQKPLVEMKLDIIMTNIEDMEQSFE